MACLKSRDLRHIKGEIGSGNFIIFFAAGSLAVSIAVWSIRSFGDIRRPMEAQPTRPGSSLLPG